jgi:tungstate transport system ATP-binding protein
MVTYRGHPVSQNGGAADRLRKKITMVHQNPFLFHTTVEKNVAYGLRARKRPRSQWKAKARECLELMGLDHLRRQQATKLSGGEAQRVAVARALAIEPEVLILDEFTANVDKNYVQVMERVIVDIFEQREITIFVVTHDDSQAVRIGHTHIRLVDGEITEHGVIRGKP